MPELDLTTFPVAAAAGCVLVLPGGGYDHLGVHEGEPVARWLNELGLHAVVLRYRLGPVAFPGALLDARRALAVIRDGDTDLNVVPGRVGVLGFSAGGHLAALLATDTREVSQTGRSSYAGRPDAAVLCYPVTDLRETLTGRIPNLHLASAANLLGDNPSGELRAELSVSTRITAPGEDSEDVPPIFCWTTSDDAGVPALHSLELMTALAVAGVPFEAHVFPHGRHGLGLATEHPHVAQWTELCEQWFADLGWLE